MSETGIMRQIRHAINVTGRAVVVRNNVGVDTMRGIRYGLGNGSADLVGMLVPSGRVFCLEVKTRAGRTSSDQAAWLGVVRKHGGFAAVVRSVDEALKALEAAERGLSDLSEAA